MTIIKLSDLNIYDVGNTIQLYGAIYASGDKVYLVPLPGEDKNDLINLSTEILDMNPSEWERFVNQTDLVEVVGMDKVILRKTQRMIDSTMQWHVFKRDGYVCRYCGQERPLTVDHIQTWESGGATVEANLLASCKKCNKIRGNTEYKDWINSDQYNKVSKNLSPEQKSRNIRIIDTLEYLKTLNVNRIRSR